MIDAMTTTDWLWLAIAFVGMYGFGCLFVWVDEGLGESNEQK